LTPSPAVPHLLAVRYNPYTCSLELCAVFRSGISRSRSSVAAIAALALGLATLCPLAANAQRHGGGSGGSLAGSSSLNAYSRPYGVDEKDSLKDFHEVLALQATSEQVAEFQALIKSTESAQADLQSLLQRLQKENPEPASADALDRALESARTATRKFQDGFSAAQKAGLKDIVKRLAKSDSDLETEDKKLAQSLLAKDPTAELVPQAEALDKALTDFSNLQLALGREMSITLSSGQDLTFMLPQVKAPVTLANRTIPVVVSGRLTQTAAQGDQRTFKLELSADLSDLQQNITELLRKRLETSETCGQRLSIRQSTLTPATPAGVLIVWLHFERWMCTRAFGQQTSTEIAEGDGKVEVKLTASIVKDEKDEKDQTNTNPNTLNINAELGRIDATGMLAESLRSGPLGDDLRAALSQSVLWAARAGTDFKIALPPVLQNSATLQSAKFQEVGVGGLSVELAGQIELSNAQADQLATQLNQTLSAQAPVTQ
jgi:hypothetical protein